MAASAFISVPCFVARAYAHDDDSDNWTIGVHLRIEDAREDARLYFGVASVAWERTEEGGLWGEIATITNERGQLYTVQIEVHDTSIPADIIASMRPSTEDGGPGGAVLVWPTTVLGTRYPAWGTSPQRAAESIMAGLVCARVLQLEEADGVEVIVGGGGRFLCEIRRGVMRLSCQICDGLVCTHRYHSSALADPSSSATSDAGR